MGLAADNRRRSTHHNHRSNNHPGGACQVAINFLKPPLEHTPSNPKYKHRHDMYGTLTCNIH
jgi:hypothetical protein